MTTLHSISEQVRELQQVVEVAEQERTRDAAEAICRVSRDLWFAYHEQWLVDHAVCVAMRPQIARWMKAGHAAVLATRTERESESGLESTEIEPLGELLGKYAISIERRLELLELLHSVSDPNEGAKRVFERIRHELG